MQLYKKRGFNEFFSDTFNFLKENGKHFFKHFLVVNGVLILILMIVSYFFMTFYFDGIFSGLNNPNAQADIDTFFNDNVGVIITFGILFILISIALGALIFSYTPLYLKLYSEKNGPHFETREFVNELKKNIGKIVIFFLVTILLAIPIVFVLLLVLILLVITIIGAILIPIPIAFMSLLVHSAFMEYLNSDKSVFQSYSYAWSLIFKKFWAAVGSVALFYFMVQVVQGIITLIPYFAGLFAMITDIEQADANSQDISGSLVTLMVVIYLLSFLVSLFCNTVIQINQGIVFYSLKEDQENINTQHVIDTIGTSQD